MTNYQIFKIQYKDLKLKTFKNLKLILLKLEKMKIFQIIVYNKILKINIKLIKQINVNKLFSMIQIF